MTTIPQDLANRLEKATLREANESRQKEWPPGIDLSFFGNELAGEVGEACNIIKKLERERLGIRGSRASIAQLAEELADVVICVDLIAMRVGVELDEAVRAKFNATSIKYGLQTRLAARRKSAPASGEMREAKFATQAYGAVVATIFEGNDVLVEVHKRQHSAELIIRNRRGETDRWDDCTADLKPEYFEMLGSVAKALRTPSSETSEEAGS